MFNIFLLRFSHIEFTASKYTHAIIHYLLCTMETAGIIIASCVGISFIIITLGWVYFLLKTHKHRKDSEANKISDFDLEILKLEFEYAKESSLQAQQDRLTLVNFYLGLFAGIATLAFGLNNIFEESVGEYMGLPFIGLGLISYVFILFIVRLRQAWVDSLRAKNKIKEYFLERNLDLKEYIIWQSHTIPSPHKFKTISQMSALLIAVLGSFGFIIGFSIIGIPIAIGSVFGVINLGISMYAYHYMLKHSH